MDYTECVYIFTQAYNAEKTIARTIESVLGQTYVNIIYYIVDSASTDRTKSIILQYANNDDRIHPIFLKKNESWEIYHIIPMILKENEDGYFVQIDADDEYSSHFVEKLLDFMKINKLEVASCASAYIDGRTGENISKALLNREIIIEGENFQILFRDYFKFFRDSWGKVFSLKVLRNIDYLNFDKSIMSGSVSFLCFEALLNAERVGIYPEQLHRYYIYTDSFERSANNYKRLLTPKLYLYYYQFIIRKCGSISEENKHFLSSSFCNSISCKLQNFRMEDMLPDEIVKIVLQIFECDFMHIVRSVGDFTTIKLLKSKLEEVINILVDKKSDQNDIEKLQKIVLLLHAEER